MTRPAVGASPDLRPKPANCQHEPIWPGTRETVVFCLRAPDLCAHLSQMRCPIQEPHPIDECGEFIETALDRRLNGYAPISALS